MSRSPKTTRIMAAAGAALIVLLGGGCGSSQITEPAKVELAPDETEIAARDDSAALEAWVSEIDGAWAELGEGRIKLFFHRNTAVHTDDSSAPWLAWLRGEAGLYDDFAKRLDELPTDSVIEPSAVSFATVVRDASSTLGLAADGMTAGNTNETSDVLINTYHQVWLECFKLQDAVAAVNLPIIDCAESGEPPAVPVTPTDGPPILALGNYDAVDAGSYRTEGFARPFTFTLPEPMRLVVNSHDIELAPVGDEGQLTFWIVAPDSLPIPGTPYGAIGDTVPFPADLGSWLAEIPVTISDTGTTQVGDLSVPYWTIPLPDDATQVGVDDWVFADFDDSFQLFPLREGMTLWQVPHPDGPLVVFGAAKFEIPGAPGLDEITAFMESILVTIEVPKQADRFTRPGDR